MMNKPSDGTKLVVSNRRARHDYILDDRYEAGLKLVGTEVKTLREGRGSLAEAYVRIDKHGEAWLDNANIPEYAFGNRNNHRPQRTRKLLLHKHELERLHHAVKAQGVTLVPLRIYFRRGRAKLEFAVGKGKNVADKRESAKKREAERAMDRALKTQRR